MNQEDEGMSAEYFGGEERDSDICKLDEGMVG